MLKFFKASAALQLFTGLVGGLVIGGGLATVNMANAGIRSAFGKPRDPISTTRATRSIAEGQERLLAFTNNGRDLIRRKGVLSVTNPSTGQYCIKPSSATLDVTKIVPAASVDWSRSSGPVYQSVQYRSSGFDCPSGTIAILTFAFNPTTKQMEASNNVAFTLQVP